MYHPSWITYLAEIRTRLIRSLWVLGVFFSICFYFSNTLYEYIASPLIQLLPHGSHMIAIEVASPFVIPLKLAFATSVFLAMPYGIYQIWAFIQPALKKQEIKTIAPLCLSSLFLFYLGMIFAFYILIPLCLKFFIFSSPNNVTIMTDLEAYLSFILSLLFVSGLAFQVPVVVFVLVLFKLFSKHQLIQYRSFVIILSFILGMLLTPPDVISQILLALPMWALFEVGLLCLPASQMNSRSLTK